MVKIQPIILTVPATGYLKFDIDIPWSIQNLTKYEMRFSESEAEIVKGNYFPLFGFGTIDKGQLSHDKFVVYNPDATGRDISLNYGEQAISHTKVDSIVTSDTVPITLDEPIDVTLDEPIDVTLDEPISVTESVTPTPIVNTTTMAQYHTGVLAGNVGVIFSGWGGIIIIETMHYDETQSATPTLSVSGDYGYYTTEFVATADIHQSLFQSGDKPFHVDIDETLVVNNGHANDTWQLSGLAFVAGA